MCNAGHSSAVMSVSGERVTSHDIKGRGSPYITIGVRLLLCVIPAMNDAPASRDTCFG